MPTPTTVTPRRAILLGLGVGVAALAVLILALVFWFDVTPDAEADARHDALDEAQAIVAARGAVRARINDALSLEFGKLKVTWQADDPVVCGRVDIEEPDDNLDGPERFVYADGQLTLESLDGGDAVARKWQDVCDG